MPPKIILIVTDNRVRSDISWSGSEFSTTPKIDEFTRQGVRQTAGYIAAAACSPTRAGLFAGLYRRSFGYEYNPTADSTRGPNAMLVQTEDRTALGNLTQNTGSYYRPSRSMAFLPPCRSTIL